MDAVLHKRLAKLMIDRGMSVTEGFNIISELFKDVVTVMNQDIFNRLSIYKSIDIKGFGRFIRRPAQDRILEHTRSKVLEYKERQLLKKEGEHNG